MKIQIGENKIQLKINGQIYTLLVANNETLVDVLREKLRLTGTKIGCNEGECGACTVLVDGEAIMSCMSLAVEFVGKSIQTIEGLKDHGTGGLHPVQKGLIDNFGIQCGFCTPGIAMSAKGLLDKNPSPSENEIRDGIQGNICRCTGYQQIVESIQAASVYLAREVK